MLLRIDIPIGKPMIVKFRNQATTIAKAPSHHPIKMNHKACMRHPGLASLRMVVDGWVDVSMVM
jgi:hypothetical protein